MSKKEEYKLKNEQFLQSLRTEEGVKELGAGVLYRVLESGNFYRHETGMCCKK